MSSVELQRVLVRMLYDPAFVDALHRDPDRSLLNCRLDAKERRWLVAADRRAFGVDPYRRGRSLLALVDEFPLASALLAQARGLSQLDRFFSSEPFHRGMQVGQSLAAMYGAFLRGSLSHSEGHAVVEFESAAARIRRHSAARADSWSFAPGVGLHDRCTVELAHYAAQTQRLRQANSVLEAISTADFSADAGRAVPSRCILVCTRPSTSFEELSPELAHLLACIEAGGASAELEQLARELGAEVEELDAILGEFLREGVLVAPGAERGS
jgi:hypothetical protein